MKSLSQVELSYCHQRDGLRPGSPRGVITASIMPAAHPATPRGEIANAKESWRTATKQFGEREVQGEHTKRAWAIGVLGSAGDSPAVCGDSPQTFASGHVPCT